MKYTTLKKIEELLRKDIEEKKSGLEYAAKKLEKANQDEADGAEKFDPVSIEYWKESKKRRKDALLEAKRALDDFLENDWH